MKNLKLHLSTFAAQVTTKAPKRGLDEPTKQAAKDAGREQFKIDQAFLVSAPVILEKLLFRAVDIFAKSKEDSSILQALCMRDLPMCDDVNQSLFTSARALYLMGQTDILDFDKYSPKGSNRSYFKVKAGKGFPKNYSEVKRIANKAAKKNKRISSTTPVEGKIKRNNSRGFYQFSADYAENMNNAINKLQATAMRVVIPDNITDAEVATLHLNVQITDAMYAEVVSEVSRFRGKLIYVTKTGCRAERIYGSEHLDITAKSTFRPFLRLARKRKITARGLIHYKAHLEAERKDLPQWHIDELEALKKGDFTNIMVEVDGNNQGPSIVAAVLQDREQFLRYWDDKDSKMYLEFLHAVMRNLELPLDTLVEKDVKYKIMTKPYNKMDESNVFGDKSFLSDLESSETPGLIISSFDFYELPLKIQLQMKLGSSYKISDEALLAAYKAAVMEVAPFLEQFKIIMDSFQENCKFTPSVWEWESFDGDHIKCARSTSDSIKVGFIDVFGGDHSFTYEFSRLLESSEWGGWTALSPTFIASIDAWLARTMINSVEFDIVTNHDAFFVHGNDVDAVVDTYRNLFTMIADNANAWLQDMGKRYMNSNIREDTTFFFLASFGKDVEPLSTEEILTASNLVGN